MVKINRTKRWLVILVLLFVLVFAAFLSQRPKLNIGSGYAAKHACSCHFLQGRELEEISEHDLNFSVLGWFSLRVEGNAVHSSLLGLVDRKAVFTPGAGCTLVNDEDLPLKNLGGDAGAATRPKNQQSPGNSLPPGWEADKLVSALDYGMQPVAGGGARGLVIYWQGRLMAERYGDGYDQTTPLLGWSMTKTLTALAIGAARHANLAPAAPPEKITGLFPDVWTDNRAQISLADLLHMNSGLAWNEGYGAITDATVMLHERPDMAEFTLRHPAQYRPDSMWVYSSGTTNTLMEYLSRELGGNEQLYGFLYDSLFHGIAPSLLIEPDQSGSPVGSSYGWANARDWANLGQFMLQDGVWQGDTLLPPGWVDYMRQPADGSDGTYGAQTWLPGPDMPSLPKDAYLMRGFQDQRVFIIPSEELIVVRIGHNEDKVADFDGLISRILAAKQD